MSLWSLWDQAKYKMASTLASNERYLNTKFWIALFGEWINYSEAPLAVTLWASWAKSNILIFASPLSFFSCFTSFKLRYTVHDKCKLRYPVNDCLLNHNRIICRGAMNVMITSLAHITGLLTTFLLQQAKIRLTSTILTVKGLNPGVISIGWVWSSGWT